MLFPLTLPRQAGRAMAMLLATTAVLALSGCGTRAEWAHRALGVDRLVSQVHEVSVHTAYGDIPTLTGGSGEPLVLVHGFAGDKDNWTRISRHLRGHYTVWAPDLLAFGDAPKDATASYLIHDQAERVVAWADAAHLARFHLGGNSMGGFIAADIAANHPDRVLSLWLIDPAGARGARPGEVEAALRKDGSLIMVATTHEQFRGMLDMVFNNHLPMIPGFVVDAMADQAIADQALRTRVFTQLTDQNQPWTSDLLPRVKAPTLVTWGDHDRVLDVSGATVLQQARPDVTLNILTGAGHSPMIDEPGRVAEAYLGWQASQPHPAAASGS